MRSKASITVFILLILGLHAVPVLAYQGLRQTRWPFLMWAMYAQSYPPGPIEAMRRELVAISSRGTIRPVSYHDVGLTRPGFSGNYLMPLGRGDTSAGRWLIDRLNQVGPDTIVRIQLETIRWRLVDTGIALDTLPGVAYPAAPGLGR
ncbi:MAG TPA: hypothetical protein VJQ46_02665 [Gemmatimonadales bacterium]|nr:hypothetical protein [Gemmatimonadales bacterium]